MFEKLFGNKQKQELLVYKESLQEVINENRLLKKFLKSLVPDFDPNDLNEELFNLKSKEINVKELTNKIKHLETEYSLLQGQVTQYKELLDEQEETIISLRSKLRSKVIEEEVKQQVDYYKKELILLNKLNDMKESKLNDLLSKVYVDDYLLSMAYDKAIKDIKDIALSVASNSKPQLVVPELNISKEE